eukprot:8949940-Pyramimonas_sp.AAC.1
MDKTQTDIETMAALGETYRKAAGGGFHRVRKRLGRAAKQRAVPPWSAPLELIALLMGGGPQLPEDVAPAGRGLGLGLQIREAPLFKSAIEDGFVRIRTAGRTPTYWHASQGVTDIGDTAFGLRIVHLIALLGKAWCAGNSSLPLVPHAVHGFVKGRCQESAMLAVTTTLYRIKQASRNCLQQLHDLSNAFGSIEWAELDGA